MNACSFGFHKWTKWQEYKEARFFLKGDTKYSYSETRQHRVCEKCGKVQDRIVH